MAYIITERGRFFVQEKGSGEPIVLLHGFPLSHRCWEPQVVDLSANYRTLALDLRGFGQSDRSNGPVTMADMADDVAAVLQAMGLASPIHLITLSMGGYVGFEFARRHPQKLRSLVLCDTRAAADTSDGANGRRIMAEKTLKEGPGVVANAMLPRLFGPQTNENNPRVVDMVRDLILSGSPAAFAAALQGMAVREAATHWIPAIQVPTLVVVGESDVISPPVEAREWVAGFPQARLVEIPNAGHMAPLEQPAIVNRILREFLSSI